MVDLHLGKYCKQLRLPAIGEQVQQMADRASAAGISYLEFAENLLDVEIKYRNHKDQERKIKTARLPGTHDLQGYDNSLVDGMRRVGKGISAQASHRTVREALTSYGSSCSKNNGYYSLIILNSVIPLLIMVVFVNSNEQAKLFAPFPLQKLRHYYDLVRHPYQLRY